MRTQGKWNPNQTLRVIAKEREQYEAALILVFPETRLHTPGVAHIRAVRYLKARIKPPLTYRHPHNTKQHLRNVLSYEFIRELCTELPTQFR